MRGRGFGVRIIEQAATGVAEFGRLDVIVNNAGFGGIGITEAYSPEQFQPFFDVNVPGAVRVNSAALRTCGGRRAGCGFLLVLETAAWWLNENLEGNHRSGLFAQTSVFAQVARVGIHRLDSRDVDRV